MRAYPPARVLFQPLCLAALACAQQMRLVELEGIKDSLVGLPGTHLSGEQRKVGGWAGWFGCGCSVPAWTGRAAAYAALRPQQCAPHQRLTIAVELVANPSIVFMASLAYLCSRL